MNITFILTVSTILWLLVDWLKTLWATSAYSKYISMVMAAVGAAAITVTFQIDLLVALGLTETASIVGAVFAGLAITAGSGLINEVIKAVAGSKGAAISKDGE